MELLFGVEMVSNSCWTLIGVVVGTWMPGSTFEWQGAGFFNAGHFRDLPDRESKPPWRIISDPSHAATSFFFGWVVAVYGRDGCNGFVGGSQKCPLIH